MKFIIRKMRKRIESWNNDAKEYEHAKSRIEKLKYAERYSKYPLWLKLWILINVRIIGKFKYRNHERKWAEFLEKIGGKL